MSAEIEPRRPVPPSPIHPLAALVTIVLDNIFGVVEIVDPLALIFTSVSVGVLGTVAVTLVQRYLAKEEWGSAIAKGLVMGIVAGVPWSVAGTAIGIPLLAWAGLHEWVKLPPAAEKKNVPEAEIIEAEFKEVDNNTTTSK